jgi:hypothetical protein
MPNPANVHAQPSCATSFDNRLTAAVALIGRSLARSSGARGAGYDLGLVCLGSSTKSIGPLWCYYALVEERRDGSSAGKTSARICRAKS